MSLDPSANFAKSTLSTGYASGVTTIVLTTGGGAKFPAPSFNATWYNSTDYSDPSDDPSVEIVRVTGVSTDTLTVARGQESTSAANHNTAGKTYTLVAGPTAKLLADVLGISITGSAAKWTTARNLAGNSVDGSADATFANAFIVKGTADSGLTGAQFLGALATGIVKNTITTGVLSIASVGDFPTLNQDTTGKAAKADALNSASTVVNVAAATAPFANQVLTATSSTAATWQGPQVSSVATCYVQADPNFSTGSSYERVVNLTGVGMAFLQLAPARTFSVTHANAIASSTTLESWTSRNTTNITSVDSNSSLAGALHIVHNTSATDDQYNTTDTAFNFYRAESGSAQGREIVAHIKLTLTQAGFGLGIGLRDPNNRTLYWMRANIIAGATPQVQANFCVNGTSSQVTANVTATDVNTNGVWLLVRQVGPGAAVYYSIANQSTPPASWTFLAESNTCFKSGVSMLESMIVAHRYTTAATTNVNGDVMYFDEVLLPSIFGAAPAADVAAAGYDDQSPVVALVGGFNLGSASATISNTDVQNALTEITNQRSMDSATVTWALNRGSSAPVAAGTYRAAGAAVVDGSGQYLSVYVKMLSTGRVLPGSVVIDRFAIPYAPAVSAVAAAITGSFTNGSVLFIASSVASQDNANFFWDGSNHRLGIGTASPSYPLDVKGVGGAVVAITATTGANALACALVNTGNTTYFGQEGSVAGTTYTNSLAYASVFGSGTAARASQILAAGAVVATFLSSGNVGIGTNAPQSLLHVVGTNPMLMLDSNNVAFSDAFIQAKCQSTSNSALWIQNYNTGYIYFTVSSTYGALGTALGISGAGNVGIGNAATAIATLLHVASNTTAVGVATLEQASADADSFDIVFRKERNTFASPSVITTADELGTIQWSGYSGAGGFVVGAAIKAISSGTIATTRIPAFLSFWTGTDAAPTVLTERMRIDNAGYVGIGTTAPKTALDVAGSVSLRGATGFTSLANGANQNVNPGTGTLIVTGTPTASFSIGGFSGGVDGRFLTLVNGTGASYVMTINHNDAGSSAGNKIYCPTGANLALAAQWGACVFQYSAVTSSWLVVGHN